MITSPGNPRIKSVVHMRQKVKARREADAFLTEGIKMFLEAPAGRIREVYISESFSCPDRDMYAAVTEKLKTLSYETVTEEVFRKISDTCSPQGILCVMEAYHYRMEDMLQKKNPLLLLLEDIQDPGNLGTMFRTGEGAGISGIIMTKNTVDLFAPKSVRSTMGSIYRMPFFITDDLPGTLGQLRAAGIHTYAAHLLGEKYYDQLDLTGAHAFLIGNEGNGLKKETADLADTYLKIPMEGRLESLNAAVAASILMYEAHRQCRQKK